MQLLPLLLACLALPQDSGPSLIPPIEVPLWPQGTPGAPSWAKAHFLGGKAPNRSMRDVHTPNLTVYPAKQKAPSAAVLICPGGGYAALSIDKEGHEIARWLAERGVCGIVLKSRLPRPTGHVYGHGAPLADLARALEIVHGRSAEWSLDTKRIGVMGFSAGGHLAATASAHLAGPRRPAFSILIYPVISMRPQMTHMGSRHQLLGPDPGEDLLSRYSLEEQVGPKTPPAFLVHTSNDPVDVRNSLAYYSALQENKIPSELHIYDRGGHGYGMRAKDLPVGQWPAALERWLGVRGIIDPR